MLPLPLPRPAPAGFFPADLPGYGLGYPLLLGPEMGVKRARQVLTALHDGGYLSPTLTSGLRVTLTGYGADARALGYAQLSFVWNAAGYISASANLQGLPATVLGAYITKAQVGGAAGVCACEGCLPHQRHA